MLQAMTSAALPAASTELPVPPVVFGLGVFGVLIALLLVTYAFRNAGSKH